MEYPERLPTGRTEIEIVDGVLVTDSWLPVSRDTVVQAAAVAAALVAGVVTAAALYRHRAAARSNG